MQIKIKVFVIFENFYFYEKTLFLRGEIAFFERRKCGYVLKVGRLIILN